MDRMTVARVVSASPCPPTGLSRAEAEAKLLAMDWELRHDGQTWCLACSLLARCPKRPLRRARRRRR
jgi:hypothetical protein